MQKNSVKRHYRMCFINSKDHFVLQSKQSKSTVGSPDALTCYGSEMASTT